MGRGNVSVQGEHEGLFYIDLNNFSSQYKDEEGNMVDDYEIQNEELQTSLGFFKECFIKKYPSFTLCDEWLDQETHAVLENDAFNITISDNEWSIAILLLQKEPDDYQPGKILGQQKRFSKIYLNGMKTCLFQQFKEIGVYGGPWTHGMIRRDDTNTVAA